MAPSGERDHGHVLCVPEAWRDSDLRSTWCCCHAFATGAVAIFKASRAPQPTFYTGETQDQGPHRAGKRVKPWPGSLDTQASAVSQCSSLPWGLIKLPHRSPSVCRPTLLLRWCKNALGVRGPWATCTHACAQTHTHIHSGMGKCQFPAEVNSRMLSLTLFTGLTLLFDMLTTPEFWPLCQRALIWLASFSYGSSLSSTLSCGSQECKRKTS